MRYICTNCGAIVLARLVWLTLAVPDPIDHCPACHKHVKFQVEQQPAAAQPNKLIFGQKQAA